MDDPMVATGEQVLGLDRRLRRRLLIEAIVRVLAITVVLVVAYFAAPIGQDADLVGVTLLVVGTVAFVGLLVFQVRRILDSPLPQLRAAEALATVVLVVIVSFALLYVGLSRSDPAAFTQPITKVNGLYFTVTVLSTVGFGDITAVTDGPRLAVTLQMLIDLLIIGVVVKIIIGASRIGMERRRAEAAATAGGSTQAATEGGAAASDALGRG